MKRLYLFLKSFKTAADLQAACMSLYDYEQLKKIFIDLKTTGRAHFMTGSSFKILKQLGCVNLYVDGIGWTATPKN